MRRDLRILWSSNGPWTNSGYGVFSRDWALRTVKEGFPLAFNCFWGLQGFPIMWNGIKCYPVMDNPWGSDGLIAHSQNFKANVVFTMQDIWSLDPNHLRQLKYWVPYVPIDKDPVPLGVLEKLQFAYRIITFSKFGQQALQKAGFTSTLIVEGTDTAIFKPLDKKEMRQQLGLPQDAFIFGMIAANKENPPRKGFQEALQAFKLFHDNHSEAMLFIHTQQPSPTGFPVQQFAQHLGVVDRLLMMNPYQAIWQSDSEFINKEMNAFDVLLHPSQTEGFGLTIIEAQSAGIPVIVNQCHSMPELIIEGKTGFASEVGTPHFTNDLSWTYPAKVDSLYEQMEKIYKLVKNNSEKVKVDCRKHIKENYNIDTIYKDKWIPMLEKLQSEILTEPIKENKLESPGK